MKRKNISSGSPYEEPIGFSRAVRIGNTIAISGTGPIPKPGQTVDMTSMYEQTKLCLQIMKKAVEDAGATLDDVIRTRIFLTDVSRWKEAAKAHGEMFGNIKPASTFVEVKGLVDSTWLVETEADCVIGDR